LINLNHNNLRQKKKKYLMMSGKRKTIYLELINKCDRHKMDLAKNLTREECLMMSLMRRKVSMMIMKTRMKMKMRVLIKKMMKMRKANMIFE
jgi:hypothetical protein